MRIFKLISTLCLILIISACGDKEMTPNEGEEYKEISIVTGLYLHDAQGIPIGKLGNSNHKPKDNMVVYPIPTMKTLSIASFDMEIKIEKVYLVKASCHNDESEMNLFSASKNLTFTDNELASKSIFEITPTENFININVEDYDSGFYRLFCRMTDGNLYWYNTFIDPSVTYYENYDFYDENCP